MPAPEKILIIRLSSLGDILHALPAFGSLRTTYPNARIDWLVEKKYRFLLSVIGGIDDVITLDTAPLRSAPWDPDSWASAREVIRLLRAKRYEFCIDFQGLLKTGLISLLSGSRIRIGFPKQLVREKPAHWFYQVTPRPPESQRHVVELNQLLAQSAGAVSASRGIRFAVDARDESSVKSVLETNGISEFVVINPGGGWPTKRWEPSRYGRLAGRIQNELHLQAVVTTGPQEQGLFEEISRHSGELRVCHLELPFLRLIPLLKRARLLVGGDTGPFHLACALGIPVVGIFGPTSPIRNGAWMDGEESVYRELPCSFCNGRTCPTQNECLDIPVEAVFQAVVRRLGRNE